MRSRRRTNRAYLQLPYPVPADDVHSLTDETIRKNWEMFGHPDGRQEVSMGIALPKWIVESSNNVWVLGAYGLLFGGALPALVVSNLTL